MNYQRHSIRAIWFACLIAWSHWTCVTPVAAQIGADIRLLPTDAVAVAVAHPRRVLTSPNMQLLPWEVYSAQGKKELGFDPLDVERVVLFAQPPTQGPPGFGAIVRLQKPFDPQRVLPNLLADRDAEKLKNGTVYHASEPFEPSVFFPNNQIIVIAMRPTLDAMLQLRGLEGELGKAIEKEPLDSDVSLVLLVTPLREQIQGALAAAPIPLPLAGFKEIPNLVDRVDFRQQWTTKASTSLSLKTANPQKAEQLQELVNSGIDLGKGLLLQQMSQQLPANDPEVAEAMSAYMRRITEHFSQLLRPKQNGDRLELHTDQADAISSTATIGVLTAILLPAVQRAREASHRASGMNNLKQIAVAMHNYHDVHNRFPAAAPEVKPDQPGKLSWRVYLLPYLEGQALFEQFHLDEPWDSEHNKQLIPLMPKFFQSPSRKEKDGKTTYLAVTGKGTIFDGPRGTNLAQITDGTSNTIMALEVANDKAVIWTKPDDWEYDAKKPFDGLDFSKRGVSLLFADGAVRQLKQKINEETWRRMMLKADGEVVEFPER